MTSQRHLDTPPVRCRYAGAPASRPHCQLTAAVRYGAVALCADCDAGRSTVGRGVTAHRLPPQPPLDVLGWISQADEQLRQAHTELAAAVQRARVQQYSWEAIGAKLKITRQAAQQRFKQDLPAGRCHRATHAAPETTLPSTTCTATARSGLGAGPLSTAPVAALYCDPWQGTVQLLAGRRHGAAQVGADGAERRGRPRGRPASSWTVPCH